MKKEKFTPVTKKGQQIFKVELNIFAPSTETRSWSSYKEGISVETLKIVYQTPRKIAMSDDWITTLERLKQGDKKESYGTYINEIVVRIKTKEDYFPNGVFCVVYSTEYSKKVIEKMESEIKKAINKEYGFLMGSDFDSKLKSVVNNFNPNL